MSEADKRVFEADCKNGYTRVANLILEALPMAQINGTELGICMFLFRRTFGWKRKQDAISLREFATACGTSTTYISRQLGDLLRKNIICRLVYEPGKTPVYTFVTNVAEWNEGCINLDELAANESEGLYQCSSKGLLDCANVEQRGLNNSSGVNIEGLSEAASYDSSNEITDGLSLPAMFNEDPATANPNVVQILNKDTNKVKSIHCFYKENEWPFKLAELLLIKIKEKLPGFKCPDLQKWARSMDRLLRLDKRPPEEVRMVIIFAQSHPFWQTNTLNVDSLRKHYDRINLMRLQQRDRPDETNKTKDRDFDAVESDEYERFFH